MSKHVSETNEKPSPRRVGDAAAYSARVQETMRYNRLRSSEYSLVMTIMNAILRGNSEEAWKEEQRRTVEALTKQTPDQGTTHKDAANRYEQTVDNLKDLMLWPW